jgi:hypothetical protein
MAATGVGYRTVNSLLMEMSYHLLQPIVYTALSQSTLAGLNVAVPVPTTLNMYPGALLVVDSGVNAEIATVISIGVGGSPPSPAFYANLNLPHSAGAMVAAATFPLQAATDPLLTQQECLAYVSRAQNQMLMDCPLHYQLTQQTVQYGQLYQSAPLNMIEMERVAVQTASGKWSRLYEGTQEEWGMTNPQWRMQHVTQLTDWGEDRAGDYGWLVKGIPATSFLVEILCSIRDSDILALTDGFLVSDVCLHGVKYKALQYCFEKDGEIRDPLRSRYCAMRYDRIVLATRRWMGAMGLMPSADAASQLARMVGGGGRRG